MRVRKSKTMWFAFVLAVLGAALEFFPYLQSFIEPKYYGFSIFAIGLGVAILRFVTVQPLSDK